MKRAQRRALAKRLSKGEPVEHKEFNEILLSERQLRLQVDEMRRAIGELGNKLHADLKRFGLEVTPEMSILDGYVAIVAHLKPEPEPEAPPVPAKPRGKKALAEA